jgi:hypothetical protein
MGFIEEQEAALQERVETLAMLKRIPAEDNFPVGTYIRWKRQRDDEPQVMHVAFKSKSGYWVEHGHAGQLTWETLIRTRIVGYSSTWKLIKLEVVTEWGDLLAPDPSAPPVTIAAGDVDSDWDFVIDDKLGNRWGYTNGRLTKIAWKDIA